MLGEAMGASGAWAEASSSRHGVTPGMGSYQKVPVAHKALGQCRTFAGGWGSLAHGGHGRAYGRMSLFLGPAARAAAPDHEGIPSAKAGQRVEGGC